MILSKLNVKITDLFEFNLHFNKGLNIIYGPNESGKTTLLHLFRYILYPFEKKSKPWFLDYLQSKATIYFLENSYEIYYDKNKQRFIPNDSLFKSIALNIDFKTFKNSFSISIEDLISFDFLTHLKNRTDILLQATSISDFKNISNIKQEFDKKLSSLFKERGKNPVINSLIIEINKLEKDIEYLKSQIEQFDDEYISLEELSKKELSLKRKLNELKDRIDLNNKLLTPFDSYLDIVVLENRKSELESELLVKNEDYKQVKELQSNIENVKREIENIEIEVSVLGKKLDEYNNNQVDENVLMRILALFNEVKMLDENELLENLKNLENSSFYKLISKYDVKDFKVILIGLTEKKDKLKVKIENLDRKIETMKAEQNKYKNAFILFGVLSLVSLFLVKKDVLIGLVGFTIFLFLSFFIFNKGRKLNKDLKLIEKEKDDNQKELDTTIDEIKNFELEGEITLKDLQKFFDDIEQTADEYKGLQGHLKKIKELKILCKEIGLKLEDAEFEKKIKMMLANSDYRQKLVNDKVVYEEKLQRKREQLRLLENKINDKLKELGVESLEDLEKGVERYNELISLEKEIIVKKERFQKLFGLKYESYKIKINSLNKYDIEKEINKLQEEISIYEDELNSILKSKSEINGKLKILVNKSELSEKEGTIELLKEKLKYNIQIYLDYFYAFNLLENTLKRFEKEFQPELLQKASVYFEKVTDGRYKKIITDFEGDYFVEGSNTQIKTIEQLSSGTRDQLFLALRLAFIDFIDNELNLPIFFDEVTANFDEEREDLFIKSLKMLSDKRQVFLFTCKYSLAEKLKSFVFKIG
ncbi:hypothetical protein DEFDS_1388 [Deferribacter desulfuricans SSM1]|uniref:YhaN AAA domain-containing protein n=1 Tax=Deferribacter desulfuricans (strain DSM 14783 / JCM 11476 / NBRC 101012 / SSM1) TaxID=639282 RepID=D3PE26_DEFDS|nr:AAA family ATPase [Deferribacter desulfuricans]BAI80849.1 hypothetical protein DEFDS_1388 [Deferribacter desulfuricans SSM1]